LTFIIFVENKKFKHFFAFSFVANTVSNSVLSVNYVLNNNTFYVLHSDFINNILLL
jgi:hypothetical protein